MLPAGRAASRPAGRGATFDQGVFTLILGALIQIFGVYTRIFVAHSSEVKGALVLKL